MKLSNVLIGETRGKSDLLIVALFQDAKQPPGILSSLDPEAFQVAKQALTDGRFNGKNGSVFSHYGDLKQTKEVLLLGLGKKDKYTKEQARRKVGSVLGQAKLRHARSIRILAESFFGTSVNAEAASELIPEILTLSEYRFDKYLTRDKDTKKSEVTSVEILYSKNIRKSVLERGFEAGRIIAESVILTRNLINEPANTMPPREMAAQARRIAREGNLRCEIQGLSEIKRQKMGGIIGVSQGSKEPPQLIILEYGNHFKKRGTLCLVGKGVCFDTGGISIKPSSGMEKMKYDMSGAAAVLGTMKAISHLKPKLQVVGIAPCVENMPDGGAQRPGDIIKMHNGKSVEVINTDAEGRLILADALSYSARFKPTALIDLATLTGACVVALSDKAIGLLGTDSNLLRKIEKAGEETGERCWELPLWDDFFDQIKGHHSDILNVGSGGGGTITAAMFLKQFVPIKRWAHLDIAGTAWVDSNKPYRARGASGIGVRLLVELIRNWK
jgi:leucyl aminopeptidase